MKNSSSLEKDFSKRFKGKYNIDYQKIKIIEIHPFSIKENFINKYYLKDETKE